eukprot:CAMPEP_0181340630 /NCGR_PEP_ID=MMETSP1101-20121128/29951_1 /TAXON_ID=46948 /ORGANISM="Rhodomonas abbreviata, Strain Caron Lab Isolate" /LENGTH=356 /DNA_ID=CAMNT_0023451797 /DNA_START=109 /DNA_END=1180 /DNA_ORIENTATION=+
MDRTGVNVGSLRNPIIDELHSDKMLHMWHSGRFVSSNSGMEAGFELPSGSAYFGELRKDGVAEGYGRHESKSDRLEYNGHFEDGKMHGEGRLKVRGSIFDGIFDQGMMVEGNYRLANGPAYSGLLNGGTWTGVCKITYPGGDVYEGAVQNGIPHGVGARTLPSGTKFTGNFRNGRKEGEGRMNLASGTNLQGQFKGGVLDGKGFVCNPDDSMLTANGRGKYEFMNGLEYDGEFRQGRMYGDGTLVHKPEGGGPDSFEFKGTMLNDRACGEGELVVGESKYSGNFEEDGPEGQWSLMQPDGKKKIQRKLRTVSYHNGKRTDVFAQYKPVAPPVAEENWQREDPGRETDDGNEDDENL